jgi:transketolase
MEGERNVENEISADLVHELRRRSNRIRQHIIEMSYGAQSGHQGGALSAAEIMAVLYFHVLKVDAKRPHWPERDRLVLSKGHACQALYSALAQRGFFPESELATFDQIGSILQGHPDMRKTPGVEMSTGCLGQGLSVGVGMALAARMDAARYRVYVIVGDGELQSGQNWEAAMSAAGYGLDNLTAIVDRNELQNEGPTETLMPLEPLAERWRAFGWDVLEINGHDVEAIIKALNQAPVAKGRPTVVIAHTVKGKGVSFMEGNKRWHSAAMKPEEAHLAMEELGREVTE